MDDTTFVVARQNPPFLCPTLFNCLTDLDLFKSWRNGTSEWQLRIVGGPGTGKSTLSTIIVQDLKQLHGPNAVAAILVQGESLKPPEDFRADVLESVYNQLAGKSFNDESELQDSEDKMHKLRNSISTRIQSFPHLFLVMDDLDSCGYQSTRLIEEELETLQKHGLRIMITSRIARYSTIEWYCDVGEGHIIDFEYNVWFCSHCYQRAEELGAKEKEDMLIDLFVTCTSCKETREVGRICSNAHDPTINLCRPFNYAQFNLDETMSKEWEAKPSEFALWTIQNEHGLIISGLSTNLWPDIEWPPLTPAARTLIADMELINDIMGHSAGNLTLAKLRLEEICEADELDGFRLGRDRLPRKVAALFNSQIAAVKNQVESVAMLGLSAIKLATKEPLGISIEDLSQRLDPLGRSRDEIIFLDVQQILHASKGLLKSRELNQGPHLQAYHPDFRLYAIERYDEDLERHNI